MSFFCLDNYMGEGSHNKSLKEKRFHYYGLLICCCLCRSDGESVDHLLLHYSEVCQLWSFALRSFGVSWVLPKRVIDLLIGWRNWLVKRSSQCLEFGTTLCDVDYLEGEK